MKKVIAIALSLVMVLSMAACGSTSGSVSSVGGSISASEKTAASEDTGEKITLTCFMSLGPVSYTHLDVYKRQECMVCYVFGLALPCDNLFLALSF